MEEIFKLCNKLKERTIGIEVLHVEMIGKVEVHHLRKILEHTFHRTGIEIVIGRERRKKTTPSKKTGNSKEWRVTKDRGENGKILIKSKGRTYADMVRQIKQNVDIEQTKVDIKRMIKTNKGDLMIEVAGGGGKAKTLGEEIKRKTDEEPIISTKEIILNITDIDVTISKEELDGEIRRNFQDMGSDDLRLLSIRPDGRGNQRATIALKKELALKIIDIGRIKIGWTYSRVRKRINIERCFKCLEHGHIAAACKGVDRSSLCIKCGKEGHKANGCQNESFCTTCDVEGHSAGQTKCPHFRSLIKSRAEQEKNEGRVRTNKKREVPPRKFQEEDEILKILNGD